MLYVNWSVWTNIFWSQVYSIPSLPLLCVMFFYLSLMKKNTSIHKIILPGFIIMTLRLVNIQEFMFDTKETVYTMSGLQCWTQYKPSEYSKMTSNSTSWIFYEVVSKKDQFCPKSSRACHCTYQVNERCSGNITNRTKHPDQVLNGGPKTTW